MNKLLFCIIRYNLMATIPTVNGADGKLNESVVCLYANCD